MYKVSLEKYWQRTMRYWIEVRKDNESRGDMYGYKLSNDRVKICLNRMINERGQFLEM